jgi:hypothetical protein
MKVCSLTEGSVIVSGQTLQCNESIQTEVSELEVIGSSLTHSVQFCDANLTVAFRNVFVNTTSAVTISSSTVRFVLSDFSLVPSLSSVQRV